MYPGEWHKVYGDKTGQSAREVMAHLASVFDLRSSVEVGCGNAHWTQAGLDNGVTEYKIADGPWNDRKDMLVDVAHFQEIDLTRAVTFDRRYDVAICLEVAEHVAAPHADNIVDTLVAAADIVLFGAAIPYQGGFGHINERWPSYWRDKFAARGFTGYDLVRPRFWHDPRLHYWYRQNAFVYVANGNADATARAEAAERELYRTKPFFDAVHPEKFEEVASYRSLAFKRLARRFPGWAIKRVRDKLHIG